MDTQDKRSSYSLAETRRERVRFHPNTQKTMQLKAYELFIPGIFHLIFVSHGWLQITKTTEDKLAEKVGISVPQAQGCGEKGKRGPRAKGRRPCQLWLCSCHLPFILSSPCRFLLRNNTQYIYMGTFKSECQCQFKIIQKCKGKDWFHNVYIRQQLFLAVVVSIRKHHKYFSGCDAQVYCCHDLVAGKD